MNYPPAIKRLMRTGFIMSLLAIISMVFSASVLMTALNDEKKIIIQKQVVLGDEKKVIETFITQLLEPKSAKCFKALLMKESSMNSRAENPRSSASGVGQLLTSTYKNIGMRHSDDALAQTVAALSYISRHYGSSGPCGAWRYWQKNFSY